MPGLPVAYGVMHEDELERYHHHRATLRRRTTWEAARGTELTVDQIETICDHAAVLTAGFGRATRPFLNVDAVVVHARSIVTRGPRSIGGRLMSSAPRRISGLSSHGRGPILLEWAAIERQVVHPGHGHNVILHEFAHKLDQLDGAADGMPPLPDREARAGWSQTIGTNFRRLRRRGPDPLVRAYAATNPAEYFAVITELFFLRPVELRERFPRVYLRLSEFYAQDPAERALLIRR